MNTSYMGEDYIVIKALENGVTIIGLTRGKDTKFHHTEKLDKGEVMVLQFTEHTSAMKIRGYAEIFHKFGTTISGEPSNKKG
ncbi:Transcription attenuation protein MtrB [Candidatus Syntrophocurvum alkaliphilum]|uniref:Transcription attenuation protein MtrB n=1 Tax=Candidatus Syntrophocurvum alkaliphilum TaxID=2293317 RepID=A0A6I6DBX0_9FIRM|nr:trp RNA-binding attenuation protein MtrB [Candidatus Syntrophocurvum alkaliphilum]QGU00189.1 Transcription attenuation protein MtrB [Candidatus Syntrophocurvum alkaliphilum]